MGKLKKQCSCHETAKAISNGRVFTIDFQPEDHLADYFGEPSPTRMSGIDLVVESVLLRCPICKTKYRILIEES